MQEPDPLRDDRQARAADAGPLPASHALPDRRRRETHTKGWTQCAGAGKVASCSNWQRIM